MGRPVKFQSSVLQNQRHDLPLAVKQSFSVPQIKCAIVECPCDDTLVEGSIFRSPRDIMEPAPGSALVEIFRARVQTDLTGNPRVY